MSFWRQRRERWRRSREIINVFTKQGFGCFFAPLRFPWRFFPFPQAPEERKDEDRGERLRVALETLGPTFIKFGQLLSMRPDFLPPDLIRALQKLQDNAYPFSFELVRQEIRAELGAEPEGLFAFFDPEPLAAASVAQVHRARLRTGEEVVVKVQRPGVKQVVETDLAILFRLAHLLQRTRLGKVYNLVGVLNELSQTFQKELNFETEAQNAVLFRKNFQGKEKVYIPAVYQAYSTPRVLTLEYLEGKKMGEIFAYPGAWDRRQLATDLAQIFAQMILKDGFFHADPHPGNIVLLPNGKIGFMDFGMVGSLEGEQRKLLEYLITSFLRKKTSQLIQALMGMGITNPQTDLVSLRREIEHLREHYTGIPLSEIRLNLVLQELFHLAFRYRLRLPANLALLAKTLGTLEAVIQRLDPHLSFTELAATFLQSLEKGAGKKMRWQKIEEAALNYLNFFQDFPRQIKEIQEKLLQEELLINLRHVNLNELTNWLDRMTNRVAVGLVSLALSILATGLIIGLSLRGIGVPTWQPFILILVFIVVGTSLAVVFYLFLRRNF